MSASVKQKSEIGGLILGAGTIVLGLYVFYRLGRKNAGASDSGGASTEYESDWFPTGAGGESSDGGTPGDTGARTGPGETAEEGAAAVLSTVIPGEMIPMSDWYYRRHVSELTGWSPQEYQDAWKNIIGEKAGGVGPGVSGHEIQGPEVRVAFGYNETVRQAKTTINYFQLITKTGGSWNKGILTPPSGWKGTATQYSQYLQKRITEGAVR
ncbi:MAG: hypothetical protein A2Z29_04740 [Chloroflexi bacterium RBG_16_56_11]|nr:MAG: hypothetical protein A2Z29_04740 [Chloroflexi bacterium RBG_16_56_11]